MDDFTRVRNAVDLVEVVARYVPLKRAGERLVALCPFHPEKSPSFGIRSGEKLFKCFGCGANGDVIEFVARIERIEPIDAMRRLAKEAGIELSGDPASAPLVPLERYRGARVLVVGGTGFVGRHLLARLAPLDVAQLAWTARDAALGEPDALGLAQGRGVRVDLRDDAAVRSLVAELRPSITFNAAGYGVDPEERDEEAAVAINDRFVGVLAGELSRRRDPAWRGLDLVHVGSALEYGSASGDLNESTEPAPTTLYGRTKLAGTQRLAARSLDTLCRGVTARLFMLYGPGEHAGRLVPQLLKTAATRAPLLLTAGTQERDFTYVGDAAEGLLRLGVSTAKPGEVVNLATGVLTSVRNFVQRAARVLEIPAELLHFGELPTRPEEMRHGPVALGRAKELLDWLPATTIEEGLRKTAAAR